MLLIAPILQPHHLFVFRELLNGFYRMSPAIFASAQEAIALNRRGQYQTVTSSGLQAIQCGDNTLIVFFPNNKEDKMDNFFSKDVHIDQNLRS